MKDLMPDADQDLIIRLHDYYFQASDLMYKNTMKLYEKLDKNRKLSQNNLVKFQSFVQLWLSTLYVVSEGFRSQKVIKFFDLLYPDKIPYGSELEMIVYWDSIHHKIGQNFERLKGYRHITFHFQENMERINKKRDEFLHYNKGQAPLIWARDLHDEMRLFFGEYRPRAAARHLHQLMIKEGRVPSSVGKR